MLYMYFKCNLLIVFIFSVVNQIWKTVAAAAVTDLQCGKEKRSAQTKENKKVIL